MVFILNFLLVVSRRSQSFLMAYQTRLCHVSDQYDLPTDLYPVAWIFVLWGLDRLSYLIPTWVGLVSHPLLLSPGFPSRYILLCLSSYASCLSGLEWPGALTYPLCIVIPLLESQF